MNNLDSLLMTIVLSDIKNAGTVKELLKDFNIYQKNKQSILLRVLVPKSLIGDQIMTQYFDTAGQMITESGVYTALKMGMVRVDKFGKKTKTDSFYLRFIKQIKTEKGEFYIYERMFPSAFTFVAGTGINAPKIVFNLVNILNNIFTDNEGVIVDEPTIINLFTTQECRIDILPSTNLDQDISEEPGEMELLQGKVDNLLQKINSKAEKDAVIYKYDLKEELPSGVTFNKDGYKTANVLFLNAEYDLPNMEYSTDKFVGAVLITNDRQEEETTKQIELFFYDTGVSQRTIEFNQDLSVKSIGDWSIKVDRKQNKAHAGEFLYIDKQGNINFTKALKDLITRSQGELLTEDTSSYDFSSMFNVTAKNKEEIVIDGADELKAVIKEINYDLEQGSFNIKRYNGKNFTIQLPTKLSQYENDTEFITKDVNNLTNYTLTDKVGNKLTFLVDPLTYVLTVNLLNPKGEVISSGQVDLPLESMVISASYENGYITLTLQNGETTRFSIAALVSGLVPTTRKINGKSLDSDIELFIPENLSDLIEDDAHRTVTDTEKTKWNNKVDKVSGKGLSTNDFTNDYKNKLDSVSSGARLYSEKGNNTDGAMTQKAASETFADLSGNQTFTGQNTFTKELLISKTVGHQGVKITNTNYRRGSIPSETIGLSRFIAYDQDGQYLTYFQSQVSNVGTTQATLMARQTTEEGGSVWKTCALNLFASKSFTWANISGNFQPSSSNKYTLGEPNFRWKGLYLSNKINTSYGVTSYIDANKGNAPIVIDRGGGNFNVLAHLKSPNGVYLLYCFNNAFKISYTNNVTINAGTNNVTKSWDFNEDGTLTTTAPTSDDNSNKVPTTNWVNNAINNLKTYDLVIRTQEEFDNWKNNISTSHYKSVLLIGSGDTSNPFKFVISNTIGILLNDELERLDGINNAIIYTKHPTGLASVFNGSTGQSDKFSINNLTIEFTGRSNGVISNINRLNNCVIECVSYAGQGDSFTAIKGCSAVVNCAVKITNKTSYVATLKCFSNCYNIYNSYGATIGGTGIEFENCTDVPIHFDTNIKDDSREEFANANKTNYYIKHSNGILEIHMSVQQNKATTITHTFPIPFKEGTIPKCHRNVQYSGTSSAGQIRSLNFNTITNTNFTIYSPDIANYGDNIMISAYGMWK